MTVSGPVGSAPGQPTAEVLSEAAERLDALAEAATPGPWQWWNLEGADQGWDNQGPDLQTVARGPLYPDGSQGSEQTVISGWGYDAWGIVVSPGDAAFIATFQPGLARALAALLRAIENPEAGGVGKWILDLFAAAGAVARSIPGGDTNE